MVKIGLNVAWKTLQFGFICLATIGRLTMGAMMVFAYFAGWTLF